MSNTGYSCSNIPKIMNTKVKSDGMSSSYYDLHIPEELFKEIDKRNKEGNIHIKTEEIIAYIFGNDFDFGTLFKSLVRAKAITEGGGKEGNTLDYELNKILYSVDRIRKLYANPTGE